MDHPEELHGVVDRIIYHNQENGFTVFMIYTSRTQSALVKGHAPALHAGQQVVVKGSWMVHPKFGKQFEAAQCSISLPTSAQGIQKYLASGMIKGIGPVYAQKLVTTFGDQTLEIIDKNPYRLHEINGIGPKRVELIITAWQDQKEISHIMVFLREKNISPTYAAKIYKKYGANSISVLHENPYRLADDIWGIGFKIADAIAQQMGYAPDSLKRISSGLLYALSQEMNNGHLYVQLEELKNKAIALLELSAHDTIKHTLKLALHELYNNRRIVLITYQENHFIALSTHYHTEKGFAQRIQLQQKAPGHITCDVDKIYQLLRTSSDIQLNEDQQRGILTALQHKVTIITGGPGTGKTTLIKKLLGILEANRVRYKLAAPTGRAAKRITESTKRLALTIHRLLEFDVSSFSFKHNEQHALPLDILIIDEASMIDIFLGYAILKALPHYAHLVLIGDIDQLPSVGAGNMLTDMITAQTIPTIRLNQIFRQKENSLIIENAHRVNRGEFPTTSLENCRRDFVYIKETDPLDTPHHLQRIFSGIQTQEDAVVLTPMNRGTCGAITINAFLQTLLNPHNNEYTVTYGGTTFKVHDRVMQIRNNYDKNVFNGDIGFIESINTVDKTVTVTYLDQLVTYDITELDEIVLAYAISIHKSQGSEFNTVIIPVFMQHFMLLQRNLLYTGITRAKRMCYLIGEPKAIGMAINNTKGTQRTTFLQQFLTSDLACR